MSVVIRQINPAGPSITFDLTDVEDLKGGVGGWASLDRARRTSAAVWTGTPAQTYTLPLLLDGMESARGVDTPVESQCAQLIAWGVGDADNAPPVLQVSGDVIVPGISRWVLQDLTWGALERDAFGRRIRQYVTVQLLAYAAPVLLKSPAKKARQNNPKKKTPPKKTPPKKGK